VIPLPKERAESEDRVAELNRGPAEISASHILIAYRGAMRAAPYVQRTKEEALALAEELQKRAVQGEDFAALAQEHSDDRGSAAQGGSLGTFRRDQMVPEFSKAAFALEVGDVSAVVESGFGFHVIKRDP
jgi:parvulin-like peptidyl-prolyl isomerase